MGRKPKIIPHIPETLHKIVEGFFAKDRAYIMSKKAEERDGKQAEKSREKKTRNLSNQVSFGQQNT